MFYHIVFPLYIFSLTGISLTFPQSYAAIDIDRRVLPDPEVLPFHKHPVSLRKLAARPRPSHSNAGPPSSHSGPPSSHSGPPSSHSGPPSSHSGPPSSHSGPPSSHSGPPPPTKKNLKITAKKAKKEEKLLKKANKKKEKEEKKIAKKEEKLSKKNKKARGEQWDDGRTRQQTLTVPTRWPRGQQTLTVPKGLPTMLTVPTGLPPGRLTMTVPKGPVIKDPPRNAPPIDAETLHPPREAGTSLGASLTRQDGRGMVGTQNHGENRRPGILKEPKIKEEKKVTFGATDGVRHYKWGGRMSDVESTRTRRIQSQAFSPESNRPFHTVAGLDGAWDTEEFPLPPRTIRGVEVPRDAFRFEFPQRVIRTTWDNRHIPLPKKEYELLGWPNAEWKYEYPRGGRVV